MASKPALKTSLTHKNQPVWLYGLLVVLGIALIVLAASALNRVNPIIAYPLEISVSQAAEKKSTGAIILDVREPSEWDQVHIPGATLIPLGQLKNRLNEIPKDQEVVVVCRSGNRSAAGRDILLNNGYTTVTSMAGGMNQWQAAGYAISSGQ